MQHDEIDQYIDQLYRRIEDMSILKQMYPEDIDEEDLEEVVERIQEEERSGSCLPWLILFLFSVAGSGLAWTIWKILQSV